MLAQATQLGQEAVWKHGSHRNHSEKRQAGGPRGQKTGGGWPPLVRAAAPPPPPSFFFFFFFRTPPWAQTPPRSSPPPPPAALPPALPLLHCHLYCRSHLGARQWSKGAGPTRPAPAPRWLSSSFGFNVSKVIGVDFLPPPCRPVSR